MEENKAQTTQQANETELRDGTDAGAVTSEAEENSSVQDGAVAENGEAQSREVNRENARRRREEERQRELSLARQAAICEALDGKNPYNGEALDSPEAVERFLAMKREAREEAAQKEAEEIARSEWFLRDREAFLEKHSEQELMQVLDDARFRAFADGKLGVLPMSEIYESYQEFLGAFDERAKSVAAQAIANRLSSPGTLGGTRHAESDHFSAEEVRRMSPAEVKANYEKIRNSMAKW